MNSLRTAIGMSLICITLASADFALDATIGGVSPTQGFPNLGVDMVGRLWYKFDQMIFVGAGSGYQRIDQEAHVPALASLWVRLPIGGQVLPVAIGDVGVNFGPQTRFEWRAAGALDIKNGDKSSLLIMGGYQYLHPRRGHAFVRGGLLLEF